MFELAWRISCLPRDSDSSFPRGWSVGLPLVSPSPRGLESPWSVRVFLKLLWIVVFEDNLMCLWSISRLFYHLRSATGFLFPKCCRIESLRNIIRYTKSLLSGTIKGSQFPIVRNINGLFFSVEPFHPFQYNDQLRMMHRAIPEQSNQCLLHFHSMSLSRLQLYNLSF